MEREIGFNNNKNNIIILFVFSILIVMRLPDVFLRGRFDAEEGMVFFAYAWHFPVWSSLWRPFAGYLNLGANASTFLDASLVRSGFISLEHAPYLTSAIALFFQMQAAVIILWGKANWLCGKYIRPLLLLTIALCPFSEEVWLNVMHIQYQLILCCGLILALDTPKNFLGWVYQAILLILAPLCGPGAIALGPLFLLRSVYDKSLPRFYQTIFLGLGSILQLSFFFTQSVVRGHFLNPFTLLSIIFVRIGIYPFFGSVLGRKVGHIALESYSGNGLAWYGFCSFSLIYFFFLIFLAWKYRKISVVWFIFTCLILAIISFGGGMISSDASSWFNAKSNERYGFIPLAFLEMAFVVIVSNVKGKHKNLLRGMCLLMLFIGFKSYIKPISFVSSGPDWKEQVRLWRNDHNYPLKVWTWASFSGVDLSDANRTCPKVSLKAASYEDPTYCETNWIAHVLSLPPTK